MTDPIARLDESVGQAVESVIIAHHRRRLRRVGRASSLQPPPGGWASGDPPPRPGNRLEILIDGEAAFSAMVAAIRAASATVHLAGWHVNPDFALSRDAVPTVLRPLLAETTTRAQVRVLLWGGSPFRVFRPSRREVRDVHRRLVESSSIRCALDTHERPLHCHHEKLVIVDDRIAFVGGIDLTDLAGDRHDTQRHPPRGAIGWHDAAARLEGPAVQDVVDHFRLRWQAVTGEPLAAAPAPGPLPGGIEVQVVRTLPEGMYSGQAGADFRILEAYLRALRSATRLIYLENQFLWSPEIVRVLRDKLQRPPTPDFRLLLVLPARPNNGNDDTRGHLGTLIEADNGAGRLLACTTYAAFDRNLPIYVHAKIGIVDDRWLTIGSANLNEHSLFNDTEVNLVVQEPAVVRNTRERLWAEHLERPLPSVAADPRIVIDEVWKPIVAEVSRTRRDGAPAAHRLAPLPGVSRRTRLLLGPLQGLVVDG